MIIWKSSDNRWLNRPITIDNERKVHFNEEKTLEKNKKVTNSLMQTEHEVSEHTTMKRHPSVLGVHSVGPTKGQMHVALPMFL